MAKCAVDGCEHAAPSAYWWSGNGVSIRMGVRFSLFSDEVENAFIRDFPHYCHHHALENFRCAFGNPCELVGVSDG